MGLSRPANASLNFSSVPTDKDTSQKHIGDSQQERQDTNGPRYTQFIRHNG